MSTDLEPTAADPAVDPTDSADPTVHGEAPDDTPRSYEEARDELAAVVARLESGGLTLDESLTLWERGEALAALCGTFLDGARERVEAALRAAGQDADAPAR